MGTLWWLPIGCYFHWLMSLFLRLLLLQDWCYFICLVCTKAKMFYCPSQIWCAKSGTDSWYSGFCERFRSPYLSGLHNGHYLSSPHNGRIYYNIQNVSEKMRSDEKMRLTKASFMPTKILHWSLLRKEVRIYVHGGMHIGSFCWILSYWFLLSLKDTNNKALSLHL